MLYDHKVVIFKSNMQTKRIYKSYLASNYHAKGEGWNAYRLATWELFKFNGLY